MPAVGLLVEGHLRADQPVAELTVQVDEATERCLRQFGDGIGISMEEAATRLLRIAASIREVMTAKGVLDADRPAEFIVTFDRHPDGVGAVDFKRIS
jgi:hypothetical protein